MYISTITYKISALHLMNKKAKKLIPETNFILYYGQKDFIFNSVYGNEIREREQSLEYSKFIIYNASGGPAKNENEYLGIKPKGFWRFCHATMQKYIDEDRIYKKGNKLRFKQIIIGNRQTNLFISPRIKSSKYPTQKSEKLMEKIICLSTL